MYYTIPGAHEPPKGAHGLLTILYYKVHSLENMSHETLHAYG